jgi:hypothetical protein
MDESMLEITVRLSAMVAQTLRRSIEANFYDDQPHRFELIGGYDLPVPNDPTFAGGTMAWCATAADMVLFAAFEQAAGHQTTLLWDLDRARANLDRVDGRDEDCHVVLSSRAWDVPAPG